MNNFAVNMQEPEAMKNSHSFKIQNLGTLHNEQSSRYSWLPWLKNKVKKKKPNTQSSIIIFWILFSKVSNNRFFIISLKRWLLKCDLSRAQSFKIMQAFTSFVYWLEESNVLPNNVLISEVPFQVSNWSRSVCTLANRGHVCVPKLAFCDPQA